MECGTSNNTEDRIWQRGVWRDRADARLGHAFEADVEIAYQALVKDYLKSNKKTTRKVLATTLSLITISEEIGFEVKFAHKWEECLNSFAAALDAALKEADPKGKRAQGGWSAATLLPSGLPCDLPCNPYLEEYTVPQSDPRKSLHGQLGVRVRADAPALPAGTFVGVYRGHLAFGNRFSKKRFDLCPRDMEIDDFHLAIESYAVDILSFLPIAEAKIRNIPLPKNLPIAEDVRLILSPFNAGGNLTCLVNDPKIEPAEEHSDGLVWNTFLAEVYVGPWPFLIMFTGEDIQPGEDLRYEYGRQYWEKIEDLMLMQKYRAKGPNGAVQPLSDNVLRNGGDETAVESTPIVPRAGRYRVYSRKLTTTPGSDRRRMARKRLGMETPDAHPSPLGPAKVAKVDAPDDNKGDVKPETRILREVLEVAERKLASARLFAARYEDRVQREHWRLACDRPWFCYLSANVQGREVMQGPCSLKHLARLHGEGQLPDAVLVFPGKAPSVSAHVRASLGDEGCLLKDIVHHAMGTAIREVETLDELERMHSEARDNVIRREEYVKQLRALVASGAVELPETVIEPRATAVKGQQRQGGGNGSRGPVNAVVAPIEDPAQELVKKGGIVDASVMTHRRGSIKDKKEKEPTRAASPRHQAVKNLRKGSRSGDAREAAEVVIDLTMID